jgi:DNA-binding response OmpR family regulator
MDMKSWKVLLVDDEEEFVNTLAERLELRGVAASVANDGESALRVVAENKPHIVILDVMMPGLKGLDVLRRIKEIDSAIQVILLTGQGATRDGIDGMRFGAFDYMMKPINIDALIEKMDEAINPKKECRQGAGS